MNIEFINVIYSLLKIRGFGYKKVNSLLLEFNNNINNVENNLLSFVEKYLEKINIPFKLYELDYSSLNDKYSKITEFKILTIIDSFYPVKIKETLKLSAPPLLFCLGNSSLLNKNSVGFCGSRKASEKGLDVVKDCAAQLAILNYVVVSGYANGVDLTAHITTLEHNGSTIIVLPEGIDFFNIKSVIKDFWNWDKILIVSEFLPDSKWSVYNAMQRNNTLISLSDAMILIEAKDKGGTFDAGKKALNLNKPLYVTVFKEQNGFNNGNRILLGKGAKELKKSVSLKHANLKSTIFEIETTNKNREKVLHSTLF